MKVAVIGSRPPKPDAPDTAHANYRRLEAACLRDLAPLPEGTWIVTGGAAGIDTVGMRYAKTHALPLLVFWADWTRFGRGAGHRRNRTILEHADEVHAFWDGQSPGTAGALKLAREMGRRVSVTYPDGLRLGQTF